jgi:hypothetical protein
MLLVRFEVCRANSWPTFVDTARIQESARLAVSLRRSILKLGVSLIPKDAREIADLFGYTVQCASLVAPSNNPHILLQRSAVGQILELYLVLVNRRR